MIVTKEMRAKILADYNAMKTSGQKAAFTNKLKKAGLPHPSPASAKHSEQDKMIAALLAMGRRASQPAKGETAQGETAQGETAQTEPVQQAA
jgi:hypothetical protein